MYSARPEAREKDYPVSLVAPPVPLIGHWGFLSFYVPAGLMPAEDVDLYLQWHGGEELYCCIREEPPFAVVQNNVGHEYRINPERFLWIPTPRFQIGDCVQARVGTLRIGWIAARLWHRKDRRLFYQISTETRKLHTRRYWDEELELYPII